MKTIVYQSYRTNEVPPWIKACMETVRSWAASKGFDYQFIDDRIFELVPPWFRAKASQEICPVVDLARLVLAKQLLAQGYDLSVWVDADMLVFAPECLEIGIASGFAFCNEVWTKKGTDGGVVCDKKVNNSITVFAQNNVHLDFFIDACQRIAYHQPQLGKLDVGTRFLSQLGQILPMLLLNNVGMFSPWLMHDIANGTQTYLKGCAQHLPAPLACANLCGSLLGVNMHPDLVVMDDALYATVIEKCMLTGGGVINQFIVPSQKNDEAQA